jgi:pyrroline-5-carboxylate reductase
VRITFIGGGNMAGAILAGLHRAQPGRFTLHVVDRNPEKGARFVREFGATHSCGLQAADAQADVLVLAVKPQQLQDLAADLAPMLSRQLLVSVAAGVRTGKLAAWLNGYNKLVWAMPNTPAQVGCGVAGLFATAAVSPAERALAESLFTAVGEVVWLEDEARMDALTAITGCGPAYVFLMVEALAAAAEAQGFAPADARRMSEATFAGALALLAQSGEDAGTLREKVTSKKGVTEQGLLALREGGLFALLAQAVERARLRSVEMGKLL